MVAGGNEWIRKLLVVKGGFWWLKVVTGGYVDYGGYGWLQVVTSGYWWLLVVMDSYRCLWVVADCCGW